MNFTIYPIRPCPMDNFFSCTPLRPLTTSRRTVPEKNKNNYCEKKYKLWLLFNVQNFYHLLRLLNRGGAVVIAHAPSVHHVRLEVGARPARRTLGRQFFVGHCGGVFSIRGRRADRRQNGGRRFDERIVFVFTFGPQ